MKLFAGQICKWLGDIAHFEVSVEWFNPESGLEAFGGMVNSHQSVSIYSCW